MSKNPTKADLPLKKTNISNKANLPLSKKFSTPTFKPRVPLNTESIENICKKAGFSPSNIQLHKILKYVQLLEKWNKSMNLVGKNHWFDIFSELVLDSFFLERFLDNLKLNQIENLQIWDLGAGAGLPGIPLRILWDQGNYSLVEAREKRSLFLETAITNLELENIEVYQGRAEQYMEEKAKKNIFADIIVSRAFMPYDKMIDFVAPYLKKENETNSKGSIIFLSLEELNPNNYNKEYWQTINSMSYKIKNKTRYICQVQIV